jgi:hypothetical protein
MATEIFERARPATVDRIIYATITIISVLIIYDGWEKLKLIDVAGVIVGPIVAMFLAHVFSAGMARPVVDGKSGLGRDWAPIIRKEAPFLLLAVPPTVVVTVLFALGATLSQSIRVTIWTGAASLGWWGFVAGRRAGLAGWRLGLAVLAGLVVGGVVLLIQVSLQPGKAVNGGVALGSIGRCNLVHF